MEIPYLPLILKNKILKCNCIHARAHMHGSVEKTRSIQTIESLSSRNQIYGENRAESKQDKQGSVGRLLNANFGCLLKGFHTGWL